MSDISPSLSLAYDRCIAIAHAHSENFPVASRLLPASIRPHIAAVYAFARQADDFADEGERTDRERLLLLKDWTCRLHKASQVLSKKSSNDDHDLIFTALGHTIRSYDLPIDLFDNLLTAFRQDVTVHRYRTWQQLLDYCRCSANPVGRLVLRITGYRDPAIEVAADHVCSGLQIVNFLQDFSRDWRNGRLYIPEEIYAAHGASEADLFQDHLNAPWREAISDVAKRTFKLFDKGRCICDMTSGLLRYELRATWLGGARILHCLERTGYDPVIARPKLGLTDHLQIFLRMLIW